MPNRLSSVRVRKIDLVDVPAIGRTITLFKSKDGEADVDEKLKKEFEEKVVALEKAKTDAEAKTAELQKQLDAKKEPNKEPENGVGELLKGAPEGLRKVIEKLEWAREEAETKAKGLEERIKKNEEDSRRKEYITKAQEFKELPGANPDDLGPILMKTKDALTEAEWQKLNAILKGSAEAVRQSNIFKELGSDFAPEGSAKAALNAKVADLRKADPKISEAAAVDRIMETDTKLADAVLAEERRSADSR